MPFGIHWFQLRRPIAAALVLLSVTGPAALSQDVLTGDAAGATARYLEAARSKPALLLAFLREMPKGGDLHNHLTGAIYAESFIDWAVAGGACIRLVDLWAVTAPCDSARGTVPATTALRDQKLYDRVVDAWSTRNWSRPLENGHDRFFGTFQKFSAATRNRGGEMLAEVVRRNAAQHVAYVELMFTPDDGAIGLGSRVGWDDDFTRLRDKLRAAGISRSVDAARREYMAMRSRQNDLMRCGTAVAEPGCNVEVRFLYQVLRGLSPEQVFAQILTAFEAAALDSAVVGLNLVMPEDGYVSMRDFPLHMRMLDYFHDLYPQVKIALHAGELAAGLVPPEGLRFHIRESIETGHASRIGHGTAIMHEDSALELLRRMADRGIAVEICLTSADVILNVSGAQHPLAVYRQFGVPTLLATDDEGVARSSITLEYKKAVEEQQLDYATLKAMARNSVTHAFVQEPVKRRLLSQLEKDFATFEAKWSVMR
jgi:adenosine deaminase